MSLRVRGQEATIKVIVDGVPKTGSWAKVKNFTLTPRSDIIEEDYLGEAQSDLDIQFHGYDAAWEVDNEDEGSLEYLAELALREEEHTRPQDVTIQVFLAFRESGARDQAIVLYNAFVKVAEIGFGGRKEYITTKYEAKVKKAALLPV